MDTFRMLRMAALCMAAYPRAAGRHGGGRRAQYGESHGRAERGSMWTTRALLTRRHAPPLPRLRLERRRRPCVLAVRPAHRAQSHAQAAAAPSRSRTATPSDLAERLLRPSRGAEQAEVAATRVVRC